MLYLDYKPGEFFQSIKANVKHKTVKFGDTWFPPHILLYDLLIGWVLLLLITEQFCISIAMNWVVGQVFDLMGT